MTSNNSQKGRFTGRHMLMIMVAFFGVIVTVNLTMATFANTSWTGLVVKNSYVASQKYNARMESSRVQAALGWTGTISPRNGGIVFVLHGQDGKPVKADRVSVRLERPATDFEDRDVVLSPGDDGSFAGDVELFGGRWNAKVEVYAGGQRKWKMNYSLLVNKDLSFAPVYNRQGSKNDLLH